MPASPTDSRQRLAALLRVADHLLKAQRRRDPREPDRREKERFERELSGVLGQYHGAQRAAIQAWLSSLGGVIDPSSVGALPPKILEDEKGFAKLVDVMTRAARRGIRLFDAEQTLRLDYTLTNAEALTEARRAALLLTEVMDKTTIESLRRSLETFVQTPGYTIRDVMDSMTDTVFGEDRRRRIAVTEITAAYARGQEAAGVALEQEYPQAVVYKRWFTNQDSLVCPVCGPMAKQKRKLKEPFEGGDGKEYQAPPAHPDCRCWMSTVAEL